MELKPCPFCGGKADFYGGLNPHNNEEEWYIGCVKCDCDTAAYATKLEAAEKWNYRVPDAFDLCTERENWASLKMEGRKQARIEEGIGGVDIGWWYYNGQKDCAKKLRELIKSLVNHER